MRGESVPPAQMTTSVRRSARDVGRDFCHRPATLNAGDQKRLGKELRQMATQINVLGAGSDTAVSLLVVLMAILAMLGIVANVAMA